MDGGIFWKRPYCRRQSSRRCWLTWRCSDRLRRQLNARALGRCPDS
jgi:hypothetical protein